MSSFIGSHYIVLDCLTWACLHKWYMLMCSCMINNVWLVCFKYIINLSGIAHGTDQYHQIQMWIFGTKLLFNVVGIVLIDIEDHQSFRRVGCDLTAKLTSDGTAATSYQNGFSTDVTENLIHIYFDRFSSKKVFHCHVFHFAEGHFSGDELIHTWKNLHFTFAFLADVQDISSLCRTCTWNCQKYLVDFIFLCTCENVITTAYNGHTLHITSPFIRVIVNNTTNLSLWLFGTFHVAENDLSCLAGTNQHNVMQRTFLFLLFPCSFQKDKSI